MPEHGRTRNLIIVAGVAYLALATLAWLHERGPRAEAKAAAPARSIAAEHVATPAP